MDATFNPGTGAENGSVFAIALQPDGNILIGGDFTHVNGKPSRGVARLLGAAAPSSLSPKGPRITNPRLSGQSFELTVSTLSGRQYTLESKSSLNDPAWQTMKTISGDGGEKTLADSSASGVQRFYRVRVE